MGGAQDEAEGPVRRHGARAAAQRLREQPAVPRHEAGDRHGAELTSGRALAAARSRAGGRRPLSSTGLPRA